MGFSANFLAEIVEEVARENLGFGEILDGQRVKSFRKDN
jgi:hypothetical protein